MPIMTMILALTLVLSFSIFINALLKLTTRSEFLLGIYLLSFANIILAGQIAGTLYLLNSRIFLLSSHFILACLACYGWYRAGRPSLLGPFANDADIFNKKNLLNSVKNQPSLWILGSCVTVAYLVGPALILIVPPNNFDSMTSHMSRVAYWLQHGSLFPWPTANFRQITDPINSQICILWTVLFSKTDRFAGFIQWLAVPVSMISIFGLARLMGFKRNQSVFAALVWATFPEIILESTTTQTHLAASALFVSGLYLLYMGLSSNNKGTFLLSGIGFALAIGTSQYIFFALPGLLITTVLIWLNNGREMQKKILIWAGICLPALFFAGSYIYIMNFISYGNPFAPSDILTVNVTSRSTNRLGEIIINCARFLYQAFDLTTGLPSSLTVHLDKLKGDLGSVFFQLLNLPIEDKSSIKKLGPEFDLYLRPFLHEDFAWFGPVSVLFLLPAVFYQLWKGLVKKDPYRLGLIIISLSLLIFSAGFMGGWTPHKNRYFILAASLCAPLMASINWNKRMSEIIRWSVILLSLVILGWTTIANEAKPLIRSVWKLDRIDKQSLNQKTMAPVIRMVNRLISPSDTLGVVLDFDEWDYPFFGKNLEHKIIQIYPHSQINDLKWLREQGINLILVSLSSSKEINIPKGLQMIGQTSGWSIFYLGEKDFSKWNPQIRTRLLDIGQASLLKIDASLAGEVGAMSVDPPQWGEDAGVRFLWLGYGEKQSVKFRILSSGSRKVKLLFNAAPGPSRTDNRRTIELLSINDDRTESDGQMTFNREGLLSFIVDLHAGCNGFEFRVLDKADILRLPNGDTRDLLVKLSGVSVAADTAGKPEDNKRRI